MTAFSQNAWVSELVQELVIELQLRLDFSHAPTSEEIHD
jgi:hypothetical protein